MQIQRHLQLPTPAVSRHNRQHTLSIQQTAYAQHTLSKHVQYVCPCAFSSAASADTGPTPTTAHHTQALTLTPALQTSVRGDPWRARLQLRINHVAHTSAWT